VFSRRSGEIGTAQPENDLTSDEALAALRDGLVGLGFDVLTGKRGRQGKAPGILRR